MKAKSWRKRLKDCCIEAGTYRPYFDSIIYTLADILEARDETQKWYKEQGGVPIVWHTNKAGAKNLEQHPALTTVASLNKQALAYFRDLGLTPVGLKRIDGKAMQAEEQSAFAELFADLEDDE